jgi:type IV pilus assembly protein PilA
MNQLSIKKKNELAQKKKKGFTLIELIIVIAIIAILAAIALPKFGQIRESGNVKADIATAKNIQTAVSTALSNGDLAYPTTTAKTLTTAELESVLASGTVPTAKASQVKNTAFTAIIGTDGIVTVEVGSTKIFPTADSPYDIS